MLRTMTRPWPTAGAPRISLDAWAFQREDGSWLLDGLMPVSELKSRLDIKDLPEDGRGRYNTVAGLLMAVSGHLPKTGEVIDCAGWHFEIAALEGRRIDRVLATADKSASTMDD